MLQLNGKTVKDLLAWGNDMLSEHSPTPLLDAQIILGHLMGMDRLALFMNPGKQIPEEQISCFRQKIEDRSKGKPVAYIVGHQEFMGLDFEVSEAVLIPRPDTEILVEAVLSSDLVKGMNEADGDMGDGKNGPRLLDLCTGSGAIAISLLYNMPGWKGVAVDLSENAVVVANANRERLLENPEVLEIQLGDVYTFAEGCEGEFDVVVSNPPYIPKEEMETLPNSVLGYEPHMALYGGVDGLDFYRKIIADGVKYLRRGGMLAVEVGHDQAEDVSKLMEQAGYNHVVTHKDLQGFERVVAAILK